MKETSIFQARPFWISPQILRKETHFSHYASISPESLNSQEAEEIFTWKCFNYVFSKQYIWGTVGAMPHEVKFIIIIKTVDIDHDPESNMLQELGPPFC